MTENGTATLMDPDDLLAMPDGDRYELVDGIPVEKHMGAESGAISARLMIRLGGYVIQHGLGQMFDAQTGCQCFPHAPMLVRKPDVTFVAAGRLPGDRLPKGNLRIAPDLAAKVISPTDLYEDVEAKVNEYLAAGVRLVWVVSPNSRTVLVRRPDGTAGVVPEAGELDGEAVVPGFRCRAADLFL